MTTRGFLTTRHTAGVVGDSRPRMVCAGTRCSACVARLRILRATRVVACGGLDLRLGCPYPTDHAAAKRLAAESGA